MAKFLGWLAVSLVAVFSTIVLAIVALLVIGVLYMFAAGAAAVFS